MTSNLRAGQKRDVSWRRCAQGAQLVAHQRFAERLRQMMRAAEMTPVPRHLTAEAPPSREVSTTDNELRKEDGMSVGG